MSELQTQLERICRRFHVASLYVFGSRAQEISARVGNLEPIPGPIDSDVDVAVMPEPGELVDPSDRVRLAQSLEDLFDIPRVDLVMLQEVGAFLALDAIRGELLYCDDEDRQAREELYHLRRAADLAPFQKARLEGLLSGEFRK